MNSDIFLFDYPFKKDILENEFYNYYHKMKYYNDPRHGDVDWLVARGDVWFDYVDELNSIFNINGSPRFYLLEAGKDLGVHTDYGTTCSINVILESNTPTPVNVSGKDYFYTTCLLNTTKPHGVLNNKEDRLLFKLSVRDESFEDVREKIRKVLG